MRSSTKTDKTSEFTLLNVDSEMYLQSLPHAKPQNYLPPQAENVALCGRNTTSLPSAPLTCRPTVGSLMSLANLSLRTLQKILQNFVSASCVSSWHTRALHDKSASP